MAPGSGAASGSWRGVGGMVSGRYRGATGCEAPGGQTGRERRRPDTAEYRHLPQTGHGVSITRMGERGYSVGIGAPSLAGCPGRADNFPPSPDGQRRGRLPGSQAPASQRIEEIRWSRNRGAARKSRRTRRRIRIRSPSLLLPRMTAWPAGRRCRRARFRCGARIRGRRARGPAHGPRQRAPDDGERGARFAGAGAHLHAHADEPAARRDPRRRRRAGVQVLERRRQLAHQCAPAAARAHHLFPQPDGSAGPAPRAAGDDRDLPRPHRRRARIRQPRRASSTCPSDARSRSSTSCRKPWPTSASTRMPGARGSPWNARGPATRS